MKVLVIGTSNIGAVKYAAPQIAAEFPDLDVQFYGLPGGKFDTMRCRKGVFGPPRSDAENVKLSRRINGVPRIDLGQFDHVLVVGGTLGLAATLWVATHYDIVDWPPRRDLPLLSQAAFRAAMDEAIATPADHLRAQFDDTPLHVARAPFPTEAVVPPGPLHQMPYAAMATHPEAARIDAMFTDALVRALSDRAMTLVPQPPETVARPFLTKEQYGHGAMDFRTDGNPLGDHRHMNADFGASLFRTFALGIETTQAAPQN